MSQMVSAALLERCRPASRPGRKKRRRKELQVRQSPQWLTFESLAGKAPGDPLSASEDKLGLWKLVNGDGRGYRWVFDLPSSLFAHNRHDPEANPSEMLASCLAWANNTFRGKCPEGRRPLPQNQIREWIGKGGLTVQAGSFVRQGEMLRSSDRLCIRFPVLSRSSDGLSDSARLWLRATLLSAQNAWRMVRLRLSEEEGKISTWAKVDFTGVPEAAGGHVVKASLAALRWVVKWLASSVVLFEDGLQPQLFETVRPRGKPERSERR